MICNAQWRTFLNGNIGAEIGAALRNGAVIGSVKEVSA